MQQLHMNEEVYTEHGPGKVIAEFPNGTICIELEHGGGHICLPEEVVPRFIRFQALPHSVEAPLSKNFRPSRIGRLSMS